MQMVNNDWWSFRAQQSQLEFTFAPDKAPATVPTEMFSNDVEGTFEKNNSKFIC